MTCRFTVPFHVVDPNRGVCAIGVRTSQLPAIGMITGVADASSGDVNCEVHSDQGHRKEGTAASTSLVGCALTGDDARRRELSGGVESRGEDVSDVEYASPPARKSR